MESVMESFMTSYDVTWRNVDVIRQAFCGLLIDGFHLTGFWSKFSSTKCVVFTQKLCSENEETMVTYHTVQLCLYPISFFWNMSIRVERTVLSVNASFLFAEPWLKLDWISNFNGFQIKWLMLKILSKKGFSIENYF